MTSPVSPQGDPARRWDFLHGSNCGADTFLDHPWIQTYVSVRGFGRLLGHMDAAFLEIARRTRPGARILSVGCGTAVKERTLARLLPDRELVAIDVATETLARAREQAAHEGLANLRLEFGDFNDLHLEAESFDAVLGLGAIHHVERLEAFWASCRTALRPGGFVLAQEYVGPSRFQWSAAQIEHGDRVLRTMVPESHRPHHDRIVPIDVHELIALDPSEAVRSAELIATCRDAGLRIEDLRGAGCGLLQPVLMDQLHTFDPKDPDHVHTLFVLFAEEDRLMRLGELGDSYAHFVAV